MAFIRWDGSLETGCFRIDEQHLVLVEAFHALQTAVQLPGNVEQAEIRLTFLEDYAGKHFRMEEALMLTHRYSDYARHKGLHDQLLLQIGDLHQRMREGRLVLTPPVLNFLHGWLVEHIQGEDYRLASFLRSVSPR